MNVIEVFNDSYERCVTHEDFFDLFSHSGLRHEIRGAEFANPPQEVGLCRFAQGDKKFYVVGALAPGVDSPSAFSPYSSI